MFVAAFNGEDPGVDQVAQRCTLHLFYIAHFVTHEPEVFGLPPDIVGAALGGLGVQQIADLEAFIPDNIILGVDECLQRCGIERTGQPTAQRQPRVSANAFPTGIKANNVFKLPVTTGPVPVFRVAATSSASAARSTSTTASESVEKRAPEVVVRSPHPEFTQFALRR
jgi:hypothetical protein